MSTNRKVTSIKIKLLVVFCIGFVGLIIVLVFLQTGNSRRVLELYEARTKEEQVILNNDLESLTQLTEALAPDYSQWDDPYNYLLGKMPDYAKDNLTEATLNIFMSDAMWMFTNKGKPVYKINITEDTEGVIDFSLYKESILNKFKENFSIKFNVPTKNGIMVIYGSTVVPTLDPQHLTPSPGYLLTGKLINNKVLTGLVGGERRKVVYVPHDELKNQHMSFPSSTGKLAYRVDFKDISDNPIGSVYSTYDASAVRALHGSGTTLLILATCIFLAFFIALFSLIWVWVVVPINKLSIGLKQENIDILTEMSQKNTEFGSIASLILKFFEQEVALKSDVEVKKSLLDKLAAGNSELEATNKAMIDRELKMIELKKQIADLESGSQKDIK